MILKGIHKEDDRTILKELGKQALVKQVRLSFIVDQLLFHQFGNYGKSYIVFLSTSYSVTKDNNRSLRQ